MERELEREPENGTEKQSQNHNRRRAYFVLGAVPFKCISFNPLHV